MIFQLPCHTKCPWHKDTQATGRSYSSGECFPGCPILWHTLYPYFLGALFGARYRLNAQGDCQVCCPADHGVDLVVKVRPNDGSFGPEIPENWNVIHAEVVAVNGPCDHGHKVGDRFMFPTATKTRFACPAGIHNLFPFLRLPMPRCINLARLRCPDWMENVYYSLEDPRP